VAYAATIPRRKMRSRRAAALYAWHLLAHHVQLQRAETRLLADSAARTRLLGLGCSETRLLDGVHRLSQAEWSRTRRTRRM